MGAMADALVAYARPLIDATDGSPEQIERAFMLSSLCYNLALVPEDGRQPLRDKMKNSLKMDDEEFEVFQQSIITPMIQRHQTMFATTRRPAKTRSPGSSDVIGPWSRTRPTLEINAEANPKTDRYAPCPCNSGRKVKFCCGKK